MTCRIVMMQKYIFKIKYLYCMFSKLTWAYILTENKRFCKICFANRFWKGTVILKLFSWHLPPLTWWQFNSLPAFWCSCNSIYSILILSLMQDGQYQQQFMCTVKMKQAQMSGVVIWFGITWSRKFPLFQLRVKLSCFLKTTSEPESRVCLFLIISEAGLHNHDGRSVATSPWTGCLMYRSGRRSRPDRWEFPIFQR